MEGAVLSGSTVPAFHGGLDVHGDKLLDAGSGAAETDIVQHRLAIRSAQPPCASAPGSERSAHKTVAFRSR